MAVATTGSPNTVPHSPTLRLLVSKMAPFSLTTADQLEEQVRRVTFEWQIAELIDDQGLGGSHAGRTSTRPRFPAAGIHLHLIGSISRAGSTIARPAPSLRSPTACSTGSG
jgi:hypothetical protein